MEAWCSSGAARRAASGSRSAASSLKFRPAERIRRRAEFQQVYERGVRIHSRYSTVFILANEAGVGRLGIAATKKLGGAVRRNRAKRLIREVFRRNKIASGFDVVVIPKRELLDASLNVLEADYRILLERRLPRAR
jgi:ribonuclease P protein component